MKTSSMQYMITFIGLMISIVCVFMISDYVDSLNTDRETLADIGIVKTSKTTAPIILEAKEEPIIEELVIPIIQEEIVYDGLTLNELTERLNKNLYSTLEGTGEYFAEYTKNTGLDPYLAVAIVLHETGCKWGCSSLAKKCNNFGGIKGKPSCGGGAYKRYDTLEDGINGYLNLVYNNYYAKGLTTPELMNPKYAESTSWASAVSKYMNIIRNS